MRRQISGKPDGSNPLIYTGSVPNMVTMPRRPTIQDGINWPLGYWWVIPKRDDAPTEEVWILMSVAQGIAVWKRLGGTSSGTAVNKMYLTTPGSGTYTPTDGMIQCFVECIGGGGGTSGADASYAGGQIAVNAAGGGSYCAKMFTSAQIGASQSYVVGASGSGGVGAVGSTEVLGANGGSSTFGSFLTASGGVAGSSVTFGVGGTSTGGDINIEGQDGQENSGSDSYMKGGNSLYGFGANGVFSTSDPNNGKNYGGGGSGYFKNALPCTGSSGAQGLIIITEYLA